MNDDNKQRITAKRRPIRYRNDVCITRLWPFKTDRRRACVSSRFDRTRDNKIARSRGTVRIRVFELRSSPTTVTLYTVDTNISRFEPNVKLRASNVSLSNVILLNTQCISEMFTNGNIARKILFFFQFLDYGLQIFRYLKRIKLIKLTTFRIRALFNYSLSCSTQRSTINTQTTVRQIKTK